MKLVNLSYSVLTFCVLIKLTVCERRDKLCLSHALVRKAGIINTQDRDIQTTYIDFSHMLTLLDSLIEHANGLVNHIDADLRHLSSVDLFAMEADGTYYAFQSSVANPESGCHLIGGDPVELSDKPKFDALGDAIKEFNEKNKNTAIPEITKFVVYVEPTDDGKLKYKLSGKELTLDSSILTPANLLKVGKAFPLYDIGTKSFVFRDANYPDSTVCKITRTDKRQQILLWKTLATRKKADVEDLKRQVVSSKEAFITMLQTLTQFTYSLGTKLRIDSYPTSNGLRNFKDELPKYSTTNIQRVGQFALANVFLDRYVDKLKEYHRNFTTQYLGKDEIFSMVLSRTTDYLVDAAKPRLQGLADTVPLLGALRDSVKSSTRKYDPNHKVLLQEVSYYSPKIDDIRTYYKIVPFPVLTKKYEVVLNTREDHLITDEPAEKCTFVSNTFLVNHCHKILGIDQVYGCKENSLMNIDLCCSKIAKLSIKEAITKCPLRLYQASPDIVRLNYDIYNYVFITSAIKSDIFYTSCPSKEEKHVANVTSLVSTRCNIKYGNHQKTTTMAKATETRVTPLYELFRSKFDEIHTLEVKPNKSDPHSLIPTDIQQPEKKFLGLNGYAWIGIGSAILLGLTGTGGVTYKLWKSTERRRHKADDLKGNYIMANAPARQNLPIYQPPTHRHSSFQFI